MLLSSGKTKRRWTSPSTFPWDPSPTQRKRRLRRRGQTDTEERTEEGLTLSPSTLPLGNLTNSHSKKEPLQEADLGMIQARTFLLPPFPSPPPLTNPLPSGGSKVQGLLERRSPLQRRGLFANLPQDDEKSFVPTPTLPQEEEKRRKTSFLERATSSTTSGRTFSATMRFST